MLPYHDTKPVGAADFYLAINATLRFIHAQLGERGLSAYLHHLAGSYFKPVTERWVSGGLPAVAGYWRAFFAAEPGGEVTVSETPGAVVIDVNVCPAIAHLQAAKRDIVPFYCQHCNHLGTARAANAGLSFRLDGGNGACRHHYLAGNGSPLDSLATTTTPIAPSC